VLCQCSLFTWPLGDRTPSLRLSKSISQRHTHQGVMSGHTCISPGTLFCQHNHLYCRPAVRSAVSSKAVCDESRRLLPTTLLARSPSQSSSKSHCGRYSSQKSKCQCVSRPEHQSRQEQIPLHILAVMAATLSLSAPAWAELQVQVPC